MEEEKEDVEEVESSTTEDVTTESSNVESEEATSKEATQETETEQQVPYDRFREVNDAKNKAESDAAYYRGLSEQKVTTVPETDPHAGQDPQTRLFYQELEKKTQKQIDTALEAKEVQYQATINALAAQNAKIQEKLFRNEQTDVKAGSPEENEIAGLISQGVDPDKAAWAIMGQKRVESAKSGKVVKQDKKAQDKVLANQEESGIPTNSGLPTGEKLSFREDLDKRARALGI